MVFVAAAVADESDLVNEVALLLAPLFGLLGALLGAYISGKSTRTAASIQVRERGQSWLLNRWTALDDVASEGAAESLLALRYVVPLQAKLVAGDERAVARLDDEVRSEVEKARRALAQVLVRHHDEDVLAAAKDVFEAVTRASHQVRSTAWSSIHHPDHFARSLQRTQERSDAAYAAWESLQGILTARVRDRLAELDDVRANMSGNR